MTRKYLTSDRGYRKKGKPLAVTIIPKRKRITGNFNTPLKQSMKATHRYSTTISIDPSAAGLLSKYIFSANGMYDPDLTSTGHQPMGFDQLALMYNHYTVVGSKITIKFINSDTNYVQLFGVSVLADSTGFTGDPHQYIEQGQSTYKICGKAGSDRSQTLTKTFSTKKFFKKSNVLDEDDLKGSSANNPTEMAFYHIVAAPLESVDAAPVLAIVLLEYTSVWHEPRTLAQS